MQFAQKDNSKGTCGESRIFEAKNVLFFVVSAVTKIVLFNGTPLSSYPIHRAICAKDNALKRNFDPDFIHAIDDRL